MGWYEMANYNAVRLRVKGEGQILTISSPHPLTKKDLETMIVHLNLVLSRLNDKPLVAAEK